LTLKLPLYLEKWYLLPPLTKPFLRNGPPRFPIKEWLPEVSKKSGNFPKNAVLTPSDPQKASFWTPLDPPNRALRTPKRGPFGAPKSAIYGLLDVSEDAEKHL